MPTTQTSPNMNIVVPVPLAELGPQWATDLQTALFTVIDQHDHTAGKGVRLTPPSLNINADLTFNSFNATALRSDRFTSQAAALNLGADIACLYSVNNGGSALGDAFWNNTAGTAIQLTRNGLPALSPVLNYRNASGSFNVTAAEISTEIAVNTVGGGATCNLPAANTVPAGRGFLLADYLGSSQANAINAVPSGTDKLNGTNATLPLQQNFGIWQVLSDGSANWTIAQINAAIIWQGTRNTNQGGNQRVYFQKNTAATSAVTVLSLTVPNNQSLAFLFNILGRPTGGSANSHFGLYSIVVANNAGTLTASVLTISNNATVSSLITSITTSLVGAVMNVQVTPASASSIDWQGFADVITD